LPAERRRFGDLRLFRAGDRDDVVVGDELPEARELGARAFDGAAFRFVGPHARHALLQRRARRELPAGFAQRGLIARKVPTPDPL
jgi:hypothetical protein